MRQGSLLIITFSCFIPYSSLGGGKTRYRHPEGRTAHIVQADQVAELYGVGIASMLAAYAELKVRPRFFSLFTGNPHQLAHAAPVNHPEGIDRQYFFIDIFR